MKRTIGRAIAATAALVALSGLWLVATDAGTLWLLSRAASSAFPGREVTVSAGSIGGSRLRSLTATDVRLGIDSLDAVVAVDSLSVRYRLLSLLSRRASISRLDMVAPSVDARVCALDLIAREAVPHTTTDPWIVDLGTISVRGGSARGGSCAPGEEWRASSVRLAASSVGNAAGWRGDVQQLVLSLRPSGAPSGYTAEVSFAGVVSGGGLRVDSLSLTSPASDVRATGFLRPLTAPAEASEIDFSLTASPVAFRDLEPFYGTLAEEGEAYIEATLTGSEDVVRVEATVDITGGGRAEIDARLSEADGDYLEYVGTAVVSSLIPSAILLDAPSDSIDATFEFDVAGPSLTALTGQARLSGGRSGASVARVDASADFSGDRVDVTATLTERGSFASAGGWFRPFAERRELELSGDFDWVLPGVSATARGSFSAAGDVTEPSAPTLTLEASLRDSDVRGTAVPEARVSADLENGAGSWTAAAMFGEGRVDADGTARLGQADTIVVERVVMRGLDLEPLLGEGRTTDLNGSGSAVHTGPWSGSGGWLTDVHLTQSTVLGVALDTAVVDLTLQEGVLTAQVQAGALAGSIDARLDGRVDGGADVRVTRASFTGLDVSAVRGGGSGLTSLTGTGGGRWVGGRPGNELTFALTDSRVRRWPVDTAEVVVTLSTDTLAASARIAGDGSVVRVRGSRSASPRGMNWQIDEASFERFELAAVVDGADRFAPLSGTLVGSLSGRSPTSAEGSVRLELAASSFGAWAYDSVSVVGTLRDGESTWSASVSGEESHGEGRAALTFLDDAPTVVGDVSMVALVAGVPVDSATTGLRFAGGALTLGSLRVWSPAIVAAGGGGVHLRPGPARLVELDVGGELSSPAPLTNWLGAAVTELRFGRFQVTASGPPDTLALRATVEAVGLTYGGATSESLTIEAGARLDQSNRTLSRIEGLAELTSVRSGSLTAPRIGVRAVPDAAGFEVIVDAQLDRGRRFDARAHVGGRPTSSDVLVRELVVTMPDQLWRLQREATVRVGDGFEIDALTLVSRAGSISASGFRRSTGPQQLRLDVEGLSLTGFSDVIGYPTLAGRLRGSLDIGGTSASPTLAGELEATDVAVAGDVGALLAQVRYVGDTLSFDGTLAGSDRRLAGASGQLAIGRLPSDVEGADPVWGLLPGRQLGVHIDADRLDVRWLAPLVPWNGAETITGQLSTDTRLAGSVDAARASGDVIVTGLSATVAALGIDPREGRLVGRFEGGSFIVDEAVVRSGDGFVTIVGTVGGTGLTNPGLDLMVTADDFLAMRTELFRAVVDGSLEVVGTAAEPRVTGQLDVLSGDVHLGGRFAGSSVERVQLTDEDYEMLAQHFGYDGRPDDEGGAPRRAGALSMNVDVRFGRDVWIRQRANPAVSVQFTGDARVEKAPHELERIYGTLEAVPRGSFVEQFGRRFSISRGTAVFNGPPEELRVDVEAEYRVPTRGDPQASEVVIGLGVVGGLNDLGLLLSSDPEMENADIVSYLATGRPANRTLQFESERGAVMERGTTMALGRATSEIERLATESVGLDVMQIRTEGLRGVTVVAGRYVSPRLYLGFTQPIGFRRTDATRSRSPEVEIEYQALRWLLLNLQRDGSRIDVFLRSRYAY